MASVTSIETNVNRKTSLHNMLEGPQSVTEALLACTVGNPAV